ncbi:MAG TPA: tetratricopeptide repeat protein, partial [Trebonia sp.]
MGDLEGAQARFIDAVAVLGQSRDRHTEGMARTGLGETLRLLGRLDESLEHHRLALAIHNEDARQSWA